MKRYRASLAYLTPSQWRAIDAWAERSFMTRRQAVETILCKWIESGNRNWLKSFIQDELIPPPGRKSDAQNFRHDIVLGWRRARRLRGRKTLVEASEDYLKLVRKSCGKSLCRATLYNWDMQLRRYGAKGLVDRRGLSAAASKAARDDRSSYKNRS